mgnify:CR=1 FL=1
MDIKIDSNKFTEEELKEIVEILNRGGLGGCIREPTLSEKIKIGLSKIFG